MKVSGFRYAVQKQVVGEWKNVMSGDDLPTVRLLYDKSIAALPPFSLRLLDHTTGTALAMHVVFTRTEKG